MKVVYQASKREIFDYNTVRATVTGLGLIPQALVTTVAHGDAHRAGDYVLDPRDNLLNENAKRAIEEWMRDERGRNSPFSKGWNYFTNELLNLPHEVWEEGVSGILTYVSVRYEKWRKANNI